MTRKGSRQRWWTTSEVAFLVENAGRMPLHDICRRLKRSSEAVYFKAKQLRSQGVPVSLRYYRPRLEACPACGCMRSTLGKHGICAVCRRRRQLEAIHARISDLLHRLPFEERETYADTEAEVESVPDPKPTMPKAKGLSRYQMCRVREQHDRDMEAWQLRTLTREVKAAQKRKERIEQKVKRVTSKPQSREKEGETCREKTLKPPATRKA